MEKENYAIKVNALKYQNYGVMNIKGRTGTIRCLVVPIADNHLFVSVNEDGSPKAVYLDLTAFALREAKANRRILSSNPCLRTFAKA